MDAKTFLYDNRHTLREIFLCAAVYLPDSALDISDSRPFVRDMIGCLNNTACHAAAARHVYNGLVRIERGYIRASGWQEYRKHMPMHDIAAIKTQMEAHGFNSLR